LELAGIVVVLFFSCSLFLKTMDGLEDTAEAGMNELVDQLRSRNRVEVRHSSRSMVMARICEELKAPTTIVKSLVFRSGVSTSNLQRLEEALRVNETVEAVSFVSLKSLEEIRAAVACCQDKPRIQSLSLLNYNPSTNHNGVEGITTIATTICETIFGIPLLDDRTADDPLLQNTYVGGVPTIRHLEVDAYPLGSQGIQILEDAIASSTSLLSLRLTRCNLRGDGASSVVKIIKRNRYLQVLDLTYNPFFLGDGFKREMTLKNIVNGGLRFNLNLLELQLQTPPAAKIPKIDRLLDINRFWANYSKPGSNLSSVPFSAWPELMARVAPKPTVLFAVLRDAAPALFY